MSCVCHLYTVFSSCPFYAPFMLTLMWNIFVFSIFLLWPHPKRVQCLPEGCVKLGDVLGRSVGVYAQEQE